MVFTSFVFAKFFAPVLIGLYLLHRREWRQGLILLASAIFYAHWNPKYLMVLAAPSVVDYVCAIEIEDASTDTLRKRWLVASILCNLGLLGYFKYANFFIADLRVLGLQIPHLDILLPVGISFFTFKTLSYTIDVYRRELNACRSMWRYAMFVTYFPELIAGPIVRASIFLPQMTRSLKPSWHRLIIGGQIILLGITKKLLIADRLALFVDPVFRYPARFTPSTVILAVVAYSIQIYCDFSGYSDMAIGISKIIGFDLPENFNMPYLACSVTEFWRRWHITLSQWLRDYLYIPLGGNRRGEVRTYVNLFLTMLLGGLWHGAAWTFVVWGALHGIGLGAHKLWMSRPTGRLIPGVRFVAWPLTYVFVCICWIFFRAASFGDAWTIIRKVLCLDSSGIEWIYSPLFVVLPVVLLGHFLGVLASKSMASQATDGVRPADWHFLDNVLNKGLLASKPHSASGIYTILRLHNAVGIFALTVWATMLLLLAPIKSNPFIYFQF
jgi:alginate O-acetyltransferase complex protein AlgI